MAGLVGPDGERYVWVMDPMTRKLKVPLSLMEPTQATSIVGTVPSLCMLFLDGRCRHPCCRQAHVSAEVLQRLRREAQQAPNCCTRHGDARDNTLLVSRFHTVEITGSHSGHSPVVGGKVPQDEGSAVLLSFPSDQIAMTVGLQRHLAHNAPTAKTPSAPTAVLSLPMKMICRLHLSRKCRYLEDCNNVHICRELEGKLPANGIGNTLGPQHCSSVLQSLRPSTATCLVGSTMYAVSLLASGPVSDTDMHQLVTLHKQSFPQIPLRIVDVRPDELVAATTAAGSSPMRNKSQLEEDCEHGAACRDGCHAAPPQAVLAGSPSPSAKA